jgi:hypothetical protein
MAFDFDAVQACLRAGAGEREKVRWVIGAYNAASGASACKSHLESAGKRTA